MEGSLRSSGEHPYSPPHSMLNPFQPIKKIEEALERDYFLTGEMAKEWGVIDQVLERRPEEPGKP